MFKIEDGAVKGSLHREPFAAMEGGDEGENLSRSVIKCSLLVYLSVFQQTPHVFKSLHYHLLLKIIKGIVISFLITSPLSFPPLASFAFCLS